MLIRRLQDEGTAVKKVSDGVSSKLVSGAINDLVP